MPEILASNEDINAHLPIDKIEADTQNTEKIQVDVARFVRSLLAGTFPITTLTAWASPTSTPEIIRAIAGRLIAAYFYYERYAEDEVTEPEYAQRLYNEATAWLNEIRTGTRVVILAGDTVLEATGDTGFSSEDFYPNDSAPDPVFSMGMELG